MKAKRKRASVTAGPKRVLADHDSIASEIGFSGKLRTNPKTLVVQKKDRVSGVFGDTFRTTVENEHENVRLTDEQKQYDLYIVGERHVDAVSRDTRAAKKQAGDIGNKSVPTRDQKGCCAYRTQTRARQINALPQLPQQGWAQKS